MEIDYRYRPRTYWPGAWTTELSTTLASTNRWFKQGLAPNSAPLFGASPASLDAGRYLPALEDGDVEIARVELASTLGDVTSVRARLGADHRIHYRIVDEYDYWPFRVTPEWSLLPLSLEELIDLIDSVRWLPGEGDDEQVGLTDAFREGLLDGDREAIELAAEFVRVDSDYYPGLRRHYELDAERWAVEQLVLSWHNSGVCDCGFDEYDLEDDPSKVHLADCRTANALRVRVDGSRPRRFYRS